MFEEMLERLIRARDRGDIEILTMDEGGGPDGTGEEQPDAVPALPCRDCRRV